MSNLVRTTITIPEDIYTQVKILAGHQQTSFSQLVSSFIKSSINIQDSVIKKDPFRLAGSYKLGINQPIHRSEIYDDKLRKKMGY